MTVAFMALLSLLLGERVAAAAAVLCIIYAVPAPPMTTPAYPAQDR